MQLMNFARQKWRPSLTMVVILVCTALISVPPLGLLAARLTSNQFVRETEQSLIHQASIYAEIYATTFARLDGPVVGVALSEDQKEHWNANLHPERSRLNGKRRLRPIEFQLSGCGDVMKRRAVGSSSGTTRRGPYAPSACCA